MNGIDFEQELYNRFGMVKDFTLGMRIGKYFYELGKQSGSSEIPNDLEEAAGEYAKGYFDDCSAAKRAADHGFIAGAKWQADHAPLPEDTVLFNKGVAEGRRLAEEEQAEMFTIVALDAAQRAQEQMMKDAVDAKIYGYDDGSYELIASWLDLPKRIYKDGDKVRIIIIKDNGKSD